MQSQTALEANAGALEKLFVAIDLGGERWQLCFSNGAQTRFRTVAARDAKAVFEEIELARRKLGGGKAVSCYEAGRDGFWLHRVLVAAGVENFVFDSSSIEVNRRARQAKTDKLDSESLVRLLIRRDRGETKCVRVVHVPSEADQDARSPQRELLTLKKERTAEIARVKSLLQTQGIVVAKVDTKLGQQLHTMVSLSGGRVGVGLRMQIRRCLARLELIGEQIAEIDAMRKQRIKTCAVTDGAGDAVAEQSRSLMNLKGIGPQFAWLYTTEFGWRKFRNRREVAACGGLAPSPFASGSTNRTLGISKAGNHRIRSMIVEIAWMWLRYQPNSKLSHWYAERFESGGRNRRIGIVAVARRLLIDLWRYASFGIVPEGALMKS